MEIFLGNLGTQSGLGLKYIPMTEKDVRLGLSALSNEDTYLILRALRASVVNALHFPA
jgi:hypothetical protein